MTDIKPSEPEDHSKPWSCGHPDCPCSGGRLHAPEIGSEPSRGAQGFASWILNSYDWQKFYLALEGIKSAASATRWANAVAPFAEAYAESERAVLLKALKKMVGWLNYAEEQDHWYFAEEQAPKFHADKAEAEAAIRKAEHDGL